MKSILKPNSVVALSSVGTLKDYTRSFAEAPAGRFSLPQRLNLDNGFSDVKQEEPSVLNTRKLIKDNILGAGKSPQVIKDGKHNPLAGKVVTFDNPWKSETLDPQDVSSDFSVVLSCGLGGGGSESNLYKSYFAISRLLDKDEVAVYSSLKDAQGRKERFTKGLPYYYDESYINEEESENFFKQVLEKRFFNSDGKLKEMRKISDLVLFGFSIGHRENISHMNYLWNKISDALEKDGKAVDLVTKYFDKIALVNIGSPVNWNDKKVSTEILEAIEKGDLAPSDIKPEHYVSEVIPAERKLAHLNIANFRSVFDMGTAKPEADFNNFHCNADLYVPEIFKFARPSAKEQMYLLGSGKVRELYFDESEGVVKDNRLGHELLNYARAIFDSPSLKHPILSLVSSPKCDISGAELGIQPLIYDQKRQPSNRDQESMKKEWYMESRVREMRKDHINHTERKSDNSR